MFESFVFVLHLKIIRFVLFFISNFFEKHCLSGEETSFLVLFLFIIVFFSVASSEVIKCSLEKQRVVVVIS